MTPLVDIVMVILIFLMLVGTFAGAEWYLQQNVPYTQTGVGGTPPPGGIPDEEPLEVRVDENATRDGFSARVGNFATGDANQLTAALEQRLRQLQEIGKKVEDVPLNISPAGNVRYRYLIAVYESAQNAGFTKIGFTTPR
jgi:biopolymer transport protein ExbD